ncbi:hypothetical protein [Streptomyces sp. NPDC093261]|uniref:hypothetical protein n=1 Tax=Streptomyces sp. NPDC093261 TaxID=3366037 RepID=UPI0037F724F0
MTHDQDTPALRGTRGRVLEGAERDAGTAVPRHPGAEPGNDEALPCRDRAGGFLDETTPTGSTVEGDEERGEGRHRLVDAAGTRGLLRIAYPSSAGHRPAHPGWVTAPGSHRPPRATPCTWDSGP